MNIKPTSIVLAALLLGITFQVYGQQSEARKYANEFLNIGVGARAFGMGNAQVAVADDVTAGYWNPAGLAQPDANMSPELSLMHAAYFANIAAYNYIGFTMPIDSSGSRRFGATLIRLGVDDIPNTLDLVDPDGSINTDKIQSFSASDFAAIFSYAWRPKAVKNLSLGANAKVIYRGAGRFGNAWGFGLDLAARYKVKAFSVGLTVKDVTQTYTAWTFNTETFEEQFINAGNEIPLNSIEITRPSARIGFAYDLHVADRLSILAAVDADVFFDGNRAGSLLKGSGVSLDPHVGLELAYMNSNGKKLAFLRGGLYNFQYLEINQDDVINQVFPTAGAGFLIKNFEIDYALANIGNFSESLHSHVVSLRFYIR